MLEMPQPLRRAQRRAGATDRLGRARPRGGRAAQRGRILAVLLLAAIFSPSPACQRQETPDASRNPLADRFSGAPSPAEHDDPGDGAKGGEGLSPSAHPETWEMLERDRDRERDPSDGGGRAWLAASAGESVGPSFPAGSAQRFEIVFEAALLGVAEGGVVFLQPSPFWGWDEPQVRYPEAPGYCEVESEAKGVELELDDSAPDLLAIRIGGRRLEPGERIRIVYGAGSAGAHVDRFAENESPIYIAVDGDGDGIRSLIAKSPRVDIVGRGPERIRVTLPSTARPGDALKLVVAALDVAGNPSLPAAPSALRFVELPDGLDLPERVELGGRYGGHRTLEFHVSQPGLYRLRAEGEGALGGLRAESNPLRVRPDQKQLLWGDLHGHSQISDGSGTPEQYFAYARDIAGLDVAALTDHDHWGMRFLDATPALWQRIEGAVQRSNEPGRFVSVLGYEWTHWLQGHRHVLFFADRAELRSSLDPAWNTPPLLWRGLHGLPALTLAHHSAGGPVATNWRYRPDPEIEPLTEIVSVHGSSEAPDTPGVIYDAVAGNFVRDALSHGYRFGFIGSGDSHDGHPGLVQLGSGGGQGGLAAIWSEARTRKAVLEALRARRSYATNGPRIELEVSIDGVPMGGALPAAGEGASAQQELVIEVAACAPIDRVDLIRGGQLASLPGEGKLEWSTHRRIPRLRPGEYHYVRVVQQDGGAAWSSPIFVRE